MLVHMYKETSGIRSPFQPTGSLGLRWNWSGFWALLDVPLRWAVRQGKASTRQGQPFPRSAGSMCSSLSFPVARFGSLGRELVAEVCEQERNAKHFAIKKARGVSTEPEQTPASPRRVDRLDIVATLNGALVAQPMCWILS